jgi:uncharacterized glyoxalase superfamily protein PhnB
VTSDDPGAAPGTSFIGVHLTVRDMEAARAFYADCGLEVPEAVGGGVHVEIPLGDGVHLALSTEALTRQYDPGWRTPSLPPGSALQLRVASRDAVDELYERLTSAGHHGQLAPTDAFWGSRYAEVDDPDGNIVGFHSPQDRGTPHG